MVREEREGGCLPSIPVVFIERTGGRKPLRLTGVVGEVKFDVVR